MKYDTLIKIFYLFVSRTDSNGNNPARTQPRTKLQPWMYDYTAYALTSGKKLSS